MNIAVVGGGFTGLTAAYELGKKGHRVTLFEKDKVLGGLAHGFRRHGWQWHLEKAYHHLFTNDHAILSLIDELGLSDHLILTRPITANYIPPPVIASEAKQSLEIATPRSAGSRDDSGVILPFDSPIHLLTYPGLSIIDKIRTAILLTSIKLNPFWQPCEWLTAKQLFLTVGGRRAWEAIWEPLMIGKFGPYAQRVAASWLWARIKKRTPRLYYIEGGFHTLVSALEQAIKKQGGIIVHKRFNPAKAGLNLKKFDCTLLTIPMPTTIPHLHAQTLILETKEPIITEAYWLNITDRSFPFLAVVAHTNMIDKKYYGNHHITYFGNYLPEDHRYLSMTAKQLYRKFLPFIVRLSTTSNFKIQTLKLKEKSLQFKVLSLKSFVGPFAQPVHELHYSRKAPKLETPTKGVYLANMDSIFPWDRGTNYAVELGRHAAEAIHQSQ